LRTRVHHPILGTGGHLLKGKRFNEEQVIAVVKEAEAGISVADLIRNYGIAEGTY